MISMKRTMINYTIPHRLPRLNEYIDAERGNRYAAAKIKREATKLCWCFTPQVKIDYPIEVTCVWSVARLSNDPDNVSFGAKFLLDALQNRGLKNDNLKYVKRLYHDFAKAETESVEVKIKKWEKNI